jgi:hypothetical protein
MGNGVSPDPSNETNPYAPPAQYTTVGTEISEEELASLGEPRAQLRVQETRKHAQWNLRVYEEDLVFFPGEHVKGGVHRISRAMAPEWITYPDGLLLKGHLLMLKAPKLGFRIEPADRPVITGWIDQSRDAFLASDLRRRVRLVLPIAILFVLTSFRCSPDPITGLPIELLPLALGLGLAVIYLLARFYPRPWVFLLDALWWAGLAAETSRFLWSDEETTTWSVVFAVIALLFMVGAARKFRRYSFKLSAKETAQPDRGS